MIKYFKYKIVKMEGDFMSLVRCQIKNFAHILDKKLLFPDVNQIARTISNVNLDLNPHQVEAALFALSKPFSSGVILADEVGLGKTIEAGIIISQKWSENKKRILIILPPNLINQWCDELNNKFFLPTFVIDNFKLKSLKQEGVENPFLRDEILICTYNFAYDKHEYLESIDWDIVVFDEAHKLLNVYKEENVMSRTLRSTFSGKYKILLTATPFMNTLMELYGITTFVDEKIFGDAESFEAQYILNRADRESKLAELSDRAKKYCVRTLRHQVSDYIHYTNRKCITQKFTLMEEEQKLYDLVANYLHTPKLYSIHNSGRPLVERGLWKRLASSSFAIAKTLEKFTLRLKKLIEKISKSLNEGEEIVTIRHHKYTEADVPKIQKEINYLQDCVHVANTIKENSKGKALLSALKTGFKEMYRLHAQHKAIIFTESRVTQDYLKKLLISNGYDKGDVVTINGENNDPDSFAIYDKWIKYKEFHKGSYNSNKRASILDYFKNSAKILIATESASEGINLQFCSLIINYDLPWNPQRIEQRIGRCHRYGQKNDVVVINFLNENNIADQRVYELLRYKFKLFDGVFGTSDGVLGAVDSLDFEKRITDIYSRCRTREEIIQAFDLLQREYEKSISDKMEATRNKMLSEFDDVVINKFELHQFQTLREINFLNRILWDLTVYRLSGDFAEFSNETLKFFPRRKKILGYYANELHYGMNEREDKKRWYRINHPLAQRIIFDLKMNLKVYPQSIEFKLPNQKVSLLENLRGKSGIFALYSAKIGTFVTTYEEKPILIGLTNEGEIVSTEQLELMMTLSTTNSSQPPDRLDLKDSDEYKKIMGFKTEEEFFTESELESIKDLAKKVEADYIEKSKLNMDKYIESETKKLHQFINDKKLSLDLKLKKLEKKIADKKSKMKKCKTIKDRIKLESELEELQKKFSDMQFKNFSKKEDLNKELEERLELLERRKNYEVTFKKIFISNWRLS